MNMIRSTVPWSPERERQLVRLFKQGDMTMVEIADCMGITKNAVIGKLHRMGLTRPENNPIGNSEAAQRSRAANKAKRAEQARIKRAQQGNVAAQAGQGYDLNAQKMPSGQGCRFIASDPKERPDGADFESLYCGHERKPGSSYCPDHHRRCYQPPRQKKKPGEVFEL